jgi:hypothetical protein
MVRMITVVVSLALPLAAAAGPRDPAAQLERGLAVRCIFEAQGRGPCDPVALRPAPDRAGRPGGAAQFDGVRSHARVLERIQPARFTVAAWIRPDTVDRVGAVVSKIRNLPGGWQKNFELRLDPGGRLFLQAPSGAGWEGVQGQRAIVPGRWTHVAAVYDGARAQLFVDGVRDGASLAVAYAQSDSEIYVGARPEGGGADGRTPSGPTFFFAGAMQDVRIYDRPLADDELAALVALPSGPSPVAAPAPAPYPAPYPAQYPPPVPPATGRPPVVAPQPDAGVSVHARYPFDGNAADASGRGQDGVLRGPKPAEDRLGNPEGALAFRQRSREYVDLGVWTEPETFTIGAWVRPADLDEMVVFSKHSSARKPFDEWLELRVDLSGRVVLELPVSSARAQVASARKLVPGKWTHVAATFDGEQAIVYVDGQKDAEALLVGFDASRGPAFAGGRPEANGKKARLGSTFDGRIDDLVILRGALPPQAVLALYAPERYQRPGGGSDEEDDRHDLVRLDRLVLRFDAACAGRNAEALAGVEARVVEEMEGEIREQQKERRRGSDRAQRTKRALQEFTALRGRGDAISLDRKRGILSDLAEAAWVELAEELDDDEWTRAAPRPAGYR